MSEIVKRAEEMCKHPRMNFNYADGPKLVMEMVAEIQRLTVALENAREALIPFSVEAKKRKWLPTSMDNPIGGSSLTNRHLLVAHNALGDINEMAAASLTPPTEKAT